MSENNMAKIQLFRNFSQFFSDLPVTFGIIFQDRVRKPAGPFLKNEFKKEPRL